MTTNFLKELEQLTNPAPSRDDDDHEDEATSARVVEKSSLLDDNDEILDADQNRRGLLRRDAMNLDEEDERYKGAVISRSMLDEDEDLLNSDDDIEDWGTKKIDDDEEDDSGDEEDDDQDDQEENDDDEEENEDDDDEEEGEESGDEDDGAIEQEDNDSTGLMKMFSNVEMRDENAKGRAVYGQIKMWEQLLGARIRFQRVLALINQLPRTEDEWQQLSAALPPSDDQKSFDECHRMLKSSLDELIHVQDQLLKRNDVLDGGSTTKNGTGCGEGDEDEVLSSPDEDEDEKIEKKTAPTRKRKLNDVEEYSNFLGDRHSAMKSFRDQTILKWFEKTRLASGRFSKSSFNAFENNALQQIEHIISDRDRLIKRTQLKRSSYSVLGKKSDTSENGNTTAGDADHEYDEEIFDDDDFYQQLLRELIERRTVGVTDPVALSRQWLELQKLRSKSKKKLVDRKASKGRRCRYDVVAKLVNFMAPVDHCPMTDEARDELFGSLFKNAA